MVKTLAYIVGVVFLAVGVLGFVPALTPNGHLLGVFEVDGIHNMVHILSGLAAIVAAAVSSAYASWYFKIFGIVYLLVTVLGFIGNDPVLGLIVVNTADNFLHLVLTALFLYAGFGLSSGNRDQMAI
jgi:hypothetical protein